jgi:hypothetical protein
VEQAEAVLTGKGRTFTYGLPYGSHPNYSWKGLGNAQTLKVIRGAFAELSKQSGAKFVETSKTSKANIRIYFQNIADGGLYEGNGKIKFSNSRAGVTAKIGRIWLLHEVMHYLGYRAAPPSDKFYHSTNKNEIYHAWGSGEQYGAHFLNWMKSRYGAK